MNEIYRSLFFLVLNHWSIDGVWLKYIAISPFFLLRLRSNSLSFLLSLGLRDLSYKLFPVC
jgi:hypothetical protein